MSRMNGKAPAVNVGGGKKPPRGGRGKSKAPAGAKEKGPAEAARERAKRLEEAGVQAIAAQEELRQHAAAWVAAIRSRVAALYGEVSDVLHAARAGTVLHGLFDGSRLNDLSIALGTADNEALALNVAGYDMPIPNLLCMVRDVCERLFPLAAEGARLLAEGDTDTDTNAKGGA